MCGHLDGEFSNHSSIIRSEQDLGVFGESMGTISGHSRMKTSTDRFRYADMVPRQYIGALAEVWLPAWPLTMSFMSRGGRG